MNTLYAGLVVWLVTLLIVESEVLRPLRDFITERKDLADDAWTSVTGIDDQVEAKFRRRYIFWRKLCYFFGCHLCTGCWVALGVALLVPGPLPLVVLNAVLYKAVGHGVLEVTALLRRTNP